MSPIAEAQATVKALKVRKLWLERKSVSDLRGLQ